MALTFRGMTLERIAYLESKKMRARMTDRKNKLTRPEFEPSFYQALQYRIAYWQELVGLLGIEEELYPEYSKMRGRAVAEHAVVRVPKLLDGPVEVDELRPQEYGENFVIKPDWGAASRGVLVLSRQADGSFLDLMSQTIIAGDSVVDEARRRLSMSRRGTVSRLIVEESVADSDQRPQEWKIFAFHGEVGLLQQMTRDRGETEMKLYRPDGTDAGRLRKDVHINDSLPSPTNLRELVDVAERLSSSIDTGFVRVDLFERASGEIVFGELCLIPGGDLYFRKGWDKHLGQMWLDANVRILAERKPLIP